MFTLQSLLYFKLYSLPLLSLNAQMDRFCHATDAHYTKTDSEGESKSKVEFKLRSFLLDVLFLSYSESEESQRSAEDSSLTPLLTFQVKSPTNKGKSTRETEGKSGEKRRREREFERANIFHLLCHL